MCVLYDKVYTNNQVQQEEMLDKKHASNSCKSNGILCKKSDHMTHRLFQKIPFFPDKCLSRQKNLLVHICESTKLLQLSKIKLLN